MAVVGLYAGVKIVEKVIQIIITDTNAAQRAYGIDNGCDIGCAFHGITSFFIVAGEEVRVNGNVKILRINIKIVRLHQGGMW